MILGSLVGRDGIVELDRSLGREIGPENVESFRDEAGDLVIKEILTNPVINEAMMRNPVITRELNAAVSKAYGPSKRAEFVANELFTTRAFGDDNAHKDLVAAEVLNNPVINDVMMRSPVIMRELNAAVSRLYQERLARRH